MASKRAEILERMKSFVRSQTIEMLLATLAKIEESASIKKLRDGTEVKDFSQEERISRGVIYTVIEEREGEEFVDALLNAFELAAA